MEAADNLLQNKLAPQKLTPRKTTYLACASTSRGLGQEPGDRVLGPTRPTQMMPPTRPAPPPPSSDKPHRHRNVLQDENLRGYDDAVVDDDDDSQDPASKIWSKIRRYSAGFSNHHRRNPSTSTAASVAASVSFPFSVTCGTEARAPGRKKATSGESNALMMQRQRVVAMESKTSLTDRTNLAMFDDTLVCGKRRSPKGSGKGRRGSGRWGFGNWWA